MYATVLGSHKAYKVKQGKGVESDREAILDRMGRQGLTENDIWTKTCVK